MSRNVEIFAESTWDLILSAGRTAPPFKAARFPRTRFSKSIFLWPSGKASEWLPNPGSLAFKVPVGIGGISLRIKSPRAFAAAGLAECHPLGFVAEFCICLLRSTGDDKNSVSAAVANVRVA